jgi:type II secretory pathway pseudopilin PulG
LKILLPFMSAKFKLLVILILSIFATAAAGTYLERRRASIAVSANTNGQQHQVSESRQIDNNLPNPSRAKYTPVPLEHIPWGKGRDPAAIALNAFADKVPYSGARKVEVVYPEPDQALVTITQTKRVKNSIDEIKYRVELTTFGGSVFVTSPPAWQIVWAGSQELCTPGQITDKGQPQPAIECKN